jgi:hypothetical protein
MAMNNVAVDNPDVGARSLRSARPCPTTTGSRGGTAVDHGRVEADGLEVRGRDFGDLEIGQPEVGRLEEVPRQRR